MSILVILGNSLFHRAAGVCQCVSECEGDDNDEGFEFFSVVEGTMMALRVKVGRCSYSQEETQNMMITFGFWR